ncbi:MULTISPECIES: DUF4145 domain-containing protein [unclassified Microbacterium]|uniref:DUF4145 domain-containing protein n=1 Tax=unclassified Microbacterium TaxID=2609290 RepID=UPI00343C7A58
MSVAASRTNPGQEEAIIECPRCRVRAQQVWGDLTVYRPKVGSEKFFDEAAKDFRSERWIDGSVHDVSGKWRTAHCQGCDQKTLWRDGVNVYPITSVAPAPHPRMDSDVKALFEEAGRVLPISRRAGAALVRAALEKQVRLLDSDPPRGTRLDDHIARLSSRVSTPLAELLDVIRHVGNASLHGAEGDDLVVMYLSDDEAADEIAEMLFDAINDLVDELVARPEKTSALWDKLPSGVKQTIERKRQGQSQ